MPKIYRAKAYANQYIKLSANKMAMVAEYLRSKADDGQNDMLDEKEDKACQAKDVVVDNAGPSCDSDMPADDGNEFNKPSKADLDTPTDKVGSHTVVPPYNKEASPETDPSEDVPNYSPPSKDESAPQQVKSEACGDDDMTKGEKGITEIPEEEDIHKSEASWLVASAYISSEERAKVPEDDFAGPKGSRSFPLRNGKDVKSAVHLVGHSPNPSETKKRIIEIAHRKGLESHLPEAWKSPDRQKASVYQEILDYLSKASPEEKDSLKTKLDPDWKEQAVDGPADAS